MVFGVFYALTPIYDFPQPKPFSGNNIYNPYEECESSIWKKGNFQVQSRVWYGLTNGRKNRNEKIHEIYRKLRYDVVVTSDYMQINPYGSGLENYIPTYEHGYGIFKNHQVCLGAKKVHWLDYPFYQTIHQKQHILNLLRPDNEIVTIAHPRLRKAYSTNDMKYLANYDLIEVFNQIRYSIPHWDSALSAGKLHYLLANDDAHDISDPNEVGRVCTFINSQTTKAEDILNALKTGKTFAADIHMDYDENFEEKAEKAAKVPQLYSVNVEKNTLTIRISESAEKIKFIGQNGKVLRTIYNADEASYFIQPWDTYVRTEIKFPNSTMFFLNPVFRYSGKNPMPNAMASINHKQTLIYRIISFSVLILLVVFAYYIVKKRKRKRRYGPKRYYR